MNPHGIDRLPLQAHLDSIVQKLRESLPRAQRGEDATAVHDARVATRRLRAAMEVLEPIVADRPRKAFGKVLKRIRRQLGPLRDIDVMLGHLDKLAAGRRGEAVAWMRQRLLEERAAALGELATGNGHKLLGKLGIWWEVEDQFVAAGDAIDPLLRAAVASGAASFAAAAQRRTSEPAGRANEPAELTIAAPAVDPHELRIAGKALRYTLEMARASGLPLDKRVLRIFKKMQDALGAWHDQVVMGSQAMELALEAELPLHDARLATAMLDLARDAMARSSQHLRGFDRLWRDHSVELQQAIEGLLREATP